MNWKFTGDRPVYQQIMDTLRGAVLQGELPPGEKVPSVRELAARAQVNPNTVQRAYNILEADGVIYSVAGKGSFISGDNKAADAILSAAKNTFRQSVEQARQAGLDEATLKQLIDTTFKGGNADD